MSNGHQKVISVSLKLEMFAVLNSPFWLPYICFNVSSEYLGVYQDNIPPTCTVDDFLQLSFLMINLSDLQCTRMKNAAKKLAVCVHPFCLLVSLISRTSLLYSIVFFQNVWLSGQQTASSV